MNLLNISAQEVSLRRSSEIGIYGINIIWTGINYAWERNTPKIPHHYHEWFVPGLDKASKMKRNTTIKTFSDLTLGATVICSGLSLLANNRDQVLAKSVVMSQSIWISMNLAQTIKLATRRARPYTRESDFVFRKRDDVYSFISGHSAIAASAATSAFLMFGQGSSNRQKVLGYSAAGMAASTILLRVLAGKHYPSDVLAGALLGMGVAWINYKIHER